MLKVLPLLASALLVALPVHVRAQSPLCQATQQQPDEQFSASGMILLARPGDEDVPIRSAPPTMWLAGFPGLEVDTIADGDCYRVTDGRVIHAFGSKDVWLRIEQLTPPATSQGKSGWINWGDSLADFNGSFVPALERSQGTSQGSAGR